MTVGGFLIGRLFDWEGAAENGCTFFDWMGLFDAFKCAGEVGAGYTHFQHIKIANGDVLGTSNELGRLFSLLAMLVLISINFSALI